MLRTPGAPYPVRTYAALHRIAHTHMGCSFGVRNRAHAYAVGRECKTAHKNRIHRITAIIILPYIIPTKKERQNAGCKGNTRVHSKRTHTHTHNANTFSKSFELLVSQTMHENPIVRVCVCGTYACVHIRYLCAFSLKYVRYGCELYMNGVCTPYTR